MNWIKENKFLAGYFVAVLIATGVLVFLLFASKGRYDEAAENYNAQLGELHRLKALPLYPNAENLKKLEEQKQEQKAKIDQLQQNLAVAKLPVEAMTPEQFQDKLRASVTDFEKKATDVGMALPKGFYMGFDRYQSIPPKRAAAPLLGRELKAIEMVLDEMPARGIVELKSIWREDLPEEEIGSGKTDPSKSAGPAKPSAKGQQTRPERQPLISRHAFEVTFLAPKDGPQFILNSVVTNKFQCMVPRLIVLKNEKEKGPLREVASSFGVPPAGAGTSPANPSAIPVPLPGAVPAPAPGTPSGPAAAETADSHTFIVGDERVETTVHVEIVDVADLPTSKPVAAH